MNQATLQPKPVVPRTLATRLTLATLLAWGPWGPLTGQERGREVTSMSAALVDPPAVTGLSLFEAETNSLKGIERLVNLRTLKLTMAQGHAIPPVIFQLRSLQAVSLTGGAPAGRPLVLPPAIANWKKLISLEVRSTAVHVPPQIAGLTALRVLDVEYIAGPNHFPWNALGPLEQLRVLLLTFSDDDPGRACPIAFPKPLGSLKKLRTLRVRGNCFREIGPAVAGLEAVEDLDLGGRCYRAPNVNRWSWCGPPVSVSPEIGRLQKLRRLRLMVMGLKQIPAEIGRIPTLQEASFIYNDLSELPPEVVSAPALRDLTLDGNLFKTEPTPLPSGSQVRQLLMSGVTERITANVARYPRLEVLSVQSKSLTEVAPEIGQLQELRKLTLLGRLTALPDTIGRLTKLNEMTLYNNRLESLPDSIAGMAELQRLELSGNALREFPRGLLRLEKLEKLDLSQNRIVEPPASLLGMKRLRNFSFGGNLHRSVPRSWVEHPTLEWIYAAGPNCPREESDFVQKGIREAKVKRAKSKGR